MYGLWGLGQVGPAFDCAGNPAPAGTVTQVDPTTGNCVSIPTIQSSPGDLTSILSEDAGYYEAPSVLNPKGSPTALNSQMWLYIGLAGVAAVSLFMLGGRR